LNAKLTRFLAKRKDRGRCIGSLHGLSWKRRKCSQVERTKWAHRKRQRTSSDERIADAIQVLERERTIAGLLGKHLLGANGPRLVTVTRGVQKRLVNVSAVEAVIGQRGG